MAVEETIKISDVVGTAGLYQTAIFFLTFYGCMFWGTTAVTVELLAPMVHIHWDWEADPSNRTIFESTSCKMDDILAHNHSSHLGNGSSRLVYESKYSRRTLTEELGMVCERSWLVSLANFLLVVGSSLGNIALPISEKIGRKPCIIALLLGSLASSLLILFTQNYAMFAIGITFYSMFSIHSGTLFFIQIMEMVPPSYSPYVGAVSKCGLLIGQMLLVGGAWILEDWFYTQAFHVVIVGAPILLVWYVLESPVCLAVRGKYDQAKEVLVKMVTRNDRELDKSMALIDSWLEEMKVRCQVNTTAETGNISDLFKNRKLALYTAGLVVTMFTFNFEFYGLVMNAESFGSGLFVDLMSSGAFSLLAVMVGMLFLTRISNRVLLSGSYFLEAITCFVYPIVYESPLARTILSVATRAFIAPIAAIFYVYMNEVFPTSVRAAGAGFVGLVSVPLSATAPFTKELGEVTFLYVPFLLFGTISLICALIYKLMPETKGRPMLHTVEELTSRRNEETTAGILTFPRNFKTYGIAECGDAPSFCNQSFTLQSVGASY